VSHRPLSFELTGSGRRPRQDRVTRISEAAHGSQAVCRIITATIVLVMTELNTTVQTIATWDYAVKQGAAMPSGNFT
jgi:hypothetical protein